MNASPPVKATYSTPMLHVRNLETSIRFYNLLGFELIDSAGRPGELSWARMHCEGGAIMFLLSEKGENIDPMKQGVLLYMYCDDLPRLREQLIEAGLEGQPIKAPEYMPSGEFYLNDPDGYRIGVAQWGEKEQQEWKARLAKRARGEESGEGRTA